MRQTKPDDTTEVVPISDAHDPARRVSRPIGMLAGLIRGEHRRTWARNDGPSPVLRWLTAVPWLVALVLTVLLGGGFALVFGVPPVGPLFSVPVLVLPVLLLLLAQRVVLEEYDRGEPLPPSRRGGGPALTVVDGGEVREDTTPGPDERDGQDEPHGPDEPHEPDGPDELDGPDDRAQAPPAPPNAALPDVPDHIPDIPDDPGPLIDDDDDGDGPEPDNAPMV
ncbi:MAG: hypothetical protein JJT89_05990 [Nitriliruptoraceae bacterium]|nr:hypothetical protein [Nitriliruptoraceae bacterium]